MLTGVAMAPGVPLPPKKIVITDFGEWFSLILQTEIDWEIIRDLSRIAGREVPFMPADQILAKAGYVFELDLENERRLLSKGLSSLATPHKKFLADNIKKHQRVPSTRRVLQWCDKASKMPVS
jgi:hypothetical protein